MKVTMKHQNIINAPYESKSKDLFIFENQEEIFKLVQEIINGTPISYLFSGYRGVGKTSIINTVIEKINKYQEERQTTNGDQMSSTKKTVVVRVNLAKYEEHTIILRKIIRHIYLSIPEEVEKNLHKKQVEFLNEFKLLYDRTYQDVSFAQSSSRKKESSRTRSISLNLKKFGLPSTISALTGISLLPLIGRVVKGISRYWYVDLLLFLGSTLWLVIEAIQYNIANSNTDSVTEEVDRKSLYDNEIAEYKIQQIFEGFTENDIELLIIIDELDKLEDKEVENLISNLKTLMLSGRASFILITGQTFYHKYKYSKVVGDSIVSSVFSKVVYVDLMSIHGLNQLFNNLVIESEELSKTIWKDYVNSKIVESNRVPRKFMNLIRQDIKWNDNRAYLEIDDTKVRLYRLDSKILNIIERVKNSEVFDQIARDPGIRDYLITQLHTSVHRMKMKKSFSKDDIFEAQEFDGETLVQKVFLNELVIMLLDTMTDELLLTKRIEQNDGGVTFQWTNPSLLDDVAEMNNPSQSSSTFLRMFTEVEKQANALYFEFTSGQEGGGHSLNALINILRDHGLLSNRWSEDSQFLKLVEIRSQLEQGKSIIASDVEAMLDFRAKIVRFRGELLEEHTYFLVRKYIEPLGYTIRKSSKQGFDYSAHSNTVDVFFETMVVINDRTQSLLNNFRRQKEKTSRESYLVIFTLHDDSQKRFRNTERFLSNSDENVLIFKLSTDSLVNRGHFENIIKRLHLDQGGNNEDHWKDAFHLLRAELKKLDPIGLFPEAPDDEYDSEIQTIIEQLPNAASSKGLAEIMRQVFVDSFDESLAGATETYMELAENVYERYGVRSRGA